jgi:hypothetical protein
MAAKRLDGSVRPRHSSGIFGLIKNSDPIALIGVCLSGGLAVGLDVTGAADGVESLLAGLMGTVVALVLDASARAERRFQLRQMFEAVPWLPELVARAAVAVTDIVQEYPDGDVEAEAYQRIQQLTEDLDELRRGRIVRSRDDYEHLIMRTEKCHATLDAITNINSEPHWWQTDLARRYWQANVAAIARGIRIRRIFIYDQLTTELRKLLEEQHQAGVKVAIVHYRTIDPASHLNFAVWDNQWVWEGKMNAQAEIISNVLMVDMQDVRRFNALFRRCWDAASFYRVGS